MIAYNCYGCYYYYIIIIILSGNHNMFIFCIDCGEAFHTFCVDIPLLTMSMNDRLLWRCINCKICEICLLASSDEMTADEAQLIYCETCDKAFHLGLYNHHHHHHHHYHYHHYHYHHYHYHHYYN